MRPAVDDTPYGRLVQALILKIEEGCDLRAQRDVAIDAERKAAQERDVLNGENVGLRTQVLDLSSKVDPLVVENTLLKADLEKQKRLTKIWTMSAIIAGAILGGGAGVYVGVKAAK